MRGSQVLLAAALFLGAPARAGGAAGGLQPPRPPDPVIVLWPPEGLSMPLSDGEWVMGSVSDPAAAFTINGASVAVHRNGAFLAWLPVSPGTFTFSCRLSLREGPAQLARRIFVTPPPAPLPARPAAVEPASLWPGADVELRPGDWLAFRMRASPSAQARCRAGRRPWTDLRETEPGNYEGLEAVLPGQALEPSAVECRLRSGRSVARASSPGKVSISSAPPAVLVVRNGAVLRTGPGKGYMLFPPPGTRLRAEGRVGSEFKVGLSPSLEAWVEAKDVEPLPPGTHPPHATAGSVHVGPSGGRSAVRVALTERVAFAVEPGEGGALTLRLYNCAGHVNWIIYDSSETFVREARWRQEDSETVALTIRLDPARTLWGWQAAYEGGALKLELRSAPALAAAPAPALKGRTVVVDPGHNAAPSASDALGPLGTREVDVNFAVAKQVESLLLARGAVPVLTKPEASSEVSLSERGRLAVEKGGDIFVSIHNNSLADGTNPFARPRGFSVFYYHPQSLPLARAVYRSYQRLLPFPGEEVRYGNLAVARISAMPAVLTESLYMPLPVHEEKLNDPAFRRRLAEAVVDGLE
ncbi:MAG: N-acetylmuramoyl-L-alanine amidase, partial [Elusimicrobia bacterium]|nr:N-acetylmuramoyl-L-alanine amidase [Elusimicrobiota bacterium]